MPGTSELMARRQSSAQLVRPMPCEPQPGTLVVTKYSERARPDAASALPMPTWFEPVLQPVCLPPPAVVPSAQ